MLKPVLPQGTPLASVTATHAGALKLCCVCGNYYFRCRGYYLLCPLVFPADGLPLLDNPCDCLLLLVLVWFLVLYLV